MAGSEGFFSDVLPENLHTEACSHNEATEFVLCLFVVQ